MRPNDSRGQDRGQDRQQRPGWTAEASLRVEVRLDNGGQVGWQRSS